MTKTLKEGLEGKGMEFGERSCDSLDELFPNDHSYADFFAHEEFVYVSQHSHLCVCGFKWWHSRVQVDQIHDDHAHECPECGRVVTLVHGWDDPDDKVKSHHIHHNHMTHAQ